MISIHGPNGLLSNGPDLAYLRSFPFFDLMDEDPLRSLVSYTLKKAHPGDPVIEAGDKIWQEVRRHLTARNLRVFAELSRVLQEFQEYGVTVIVLKGAALTERVYPHPGLRFFSDIDLLIKLADLPRIVDALLRLGFSPLSPQFGLGSEVFQISLHYVKNKELPIAIEPHWALGRVYPYAGRVKVEDLWDRAVPLKIAGVDTLTLCPEDFLLHLCLHLVQHSQHGWLVSACDMAALIHHYQDQLDWQSFVKRVREYRLYLPVRYSLRKVENLFRPPIPPAVFHELDLYHPSWFETRVFSLLTNPSRKAGPVAQLLSTPGFRPRLQFLCGIIFPSKEYMMARYDIQVPKMLPYFYLRRLKEGLKQGIEALRPLTQTHPSK